MMFVLEAACALNPGKDLIQMAEQFQESGRIRRARPRLHLHVNRGTVGEDILHRRVCGLLWFTSATHG